MIRRHILIGGAAVAIAGGGGILAARRNMGSMADYNAEVAATRSVLSARPEIRDIIRFATLAPNGHNTQPWTFRLRPGSVTITPDLTRRTPVLDPDDHHLWVSLGCAGESLALAARASGQPGDLRFDPSGGIVFAFGDGPAPEPTLSDAIPNRQSTRAGYDGGPIAMGDLVLLENAAKIPGVSIVLMTDKN